MRPGHGVDPHASTLPFFAVAGSQAWAAQGVPTAFWRKEVPPCSCSLDFPILFPQTPLSGSRLFSGPQAGMGSIRAAHGHLRRASCSPRRTCPSSTSPPSLEGQDPCCETPPVPRGMVSILLNIKTGEHAHHPATRSHQVGITNRHRRQWGHPCDLSGLCLLVCKMGVMTGPASQEGWEASAQVNVRKQLESPGSSLKAAWPREVILHLWASVASAVKGR